MGENLASTESKCCTEKKILQLFRETDTITGFVFPRMFAMLFWLVVDAVAVTAIILTVGDTNLRTSRSQAYSLQEASPLKKVVCIHTFIKNKKPS